jgi:hypothetical protein
MAGQDGRDGRDGKDGAPGRDAAQIEILEAIDEQRSYARGTYARHAGGIVRAFRATDPLSDEGLEKAGWQVVVAGFRGVEFTHVDERSLRVSLVMTDGKSMDHTLQWPVMIYRGIWSEGEYQRGDTVTRDGSLWHCERTTCDRPGDTTDWKLATKRGRDGKDGKNGERGERGLQGQPGRDLTHLGNRL